MIGLFDDEDDDFWAEDVEIFDGNVSIDEDSEDLPNHFNPTNFNDE